MAEPSAPNVAPGFYAIDLNDPPRLAQHLRAIGWIEPDERLLDVGRAGEGNMNCTMRVVTTTRRFILKQSRPWVEKYPHIRAPEDRALIEGTFYRSVSADPHIRRLMPRLLAVDAPSRLLMLEDLGSASDLTALYGGGTLTQEDIAQLVAYLVRLHSLGLSSSETAIFANRAMRELNHHHIFQFPLQENGLDLDRLTPGLETLAADLKSQRAYVEAVARAGDWYLADGRSLVHGDFFPGSWLRLADGLRVIDPEFCFAGVPEFDVGVMIAHLLLARQPPSSIQLVLKLYHAHATLDGALVAPFAGIEVMRRLIGVAQLSLRASLTRKRRLLELSRTLVLSPETLESLKE